MVIGVEYEIIKMNARFSTENKTTETLCLGLGAYLLSEFSSHSQNLHRTSKISIIWPGSEIQEVHRFPPDYIAVAKISKDCEAFLKIQESSES
jgi:hypothetical protein